MMSALSFTVKAGEMPTGYVPGTTIPLMAPGGKLNVSIDRGGTFTDVICTYPTHPSLVSKHGAVSTRVIKLLSVNPQSYQDAPREAIRRLLEELTGDKHPINELIDSSRLECIRMGTTVATNALLERKGEDILLLTTRGLEDVVKIGNQSRPNIFALNIEKPEVISKYIVGVEERVRVIATTDSNNSIELDETSARSHSHTNTHTDEATTTCVLGEEVDTVRGHTGEWVQVLAPIDTDATRATLQHHYDLGVRSVAIVFAHSYAFDAHELTAASLAREVGYTHVSVSSQLIPSVRLLNRVYTTCADAYLTPCIKTYISNFVGGFDAAFPSRVRLLFMQSDGGLTAVDAFSGYRAVLSGPAGGVVGFSRTGFIDSESDSDVRMDDGDSNSFSRRSLLGTKSPLIGFDMGGTSCDVSRFDGHQDYIFENVTAGVCIQAPQLDINTVAAGGGSILAFKAGLLHVGPESASSNPGPTCYRNDGPLTVTDANLVLGKIIPKHFPKVFGPNQDLPLDSEASLAKFDLLTKQINAWRAVNLPSATALSVHDVALGYISIANEAMCRPIRAITESKGIDVTNHVLACFGAAGGQHACEIARILGMKDIHIHKHSGILSAYGISLADIIVEKQLPVHQYLSSDVCVAIDALHQQLLDANTSSLKQQGVEAKDGVQVSHEAYVGVKYEGTDTVLSVPLSPDSLSVLHSDPHALVADVEAAFTARYQSEYGFTLQKRLLVEVLRLKSTGHHQQQSDASNSASEASVDDKTYTVQPPPQAADVARLYLNDASGTTGAWCDAPTYLEASLVPGTVVEGPCLIVGVNSTVVVEHQWRVYVGDCELILKHSQPPRSSPSKSTTTNVTSLAEARATVDCDSVQLSIFAHRFMSIAEQMGRTLQRTSISTNIKERLDFSCALFSADGGLVANAPHLPVHLGALSEAIKKQIEKHRGKWCAGDVIVSNHPTMGGSHLPDITVITPIFAVSSSSQASPTHPHDKSAPLTPLFFVANRGHHADIGGITPGSMPSSSQCLAEEGIAIESFFLVRGAGRAGPPGFDEEGISMILNGHRSEAEVNEWRDTGVLPSTSTTTTGTRCLADNLSDLRAQVAANHKGLLLMESLIATYTLPVVQSYMFYIQEAAEHVVRELLCEVANRYSQHMHRGVVSLPTCVEYMDDGSPIQLTVTIDTNPTVTADGRTVKGSAVFDFTGTSVQVMGNFNAPTAITYSAIIYSVRSLVRDSIPLNQGCLYPISIVIPPLSLLAPFRGAAVVGGNVTTSQRITDVILRVMGACAASQGCMNSLTFGSTSFGYYETIGGGAGAGDGWEGASGVHTHMTNTRITDVEVIERRYPVLVRQFGLRTGSGGVGVYRGGEGIVREIQFLSPLTVNIISERRTQAPYGMAGGGSAKKGENYIVRFAQCCEAGVCPHQDKLPVHYTRDARYCESGVTHGLRVRIGGKATVSVAEGDSILLLTPGGGGYGNDDEDTADCDNKRKRVKRVDTQASTSVGVVPPMSHGSLAQYEYNQGTV